MTEQPLIHDATITLKAPVQLWTRADGSMRMPIDGVYLADTRVADSLVWTIGGRAGEHIATVSENASRTRFVALHRALDGEGADPDVESALVLQVTRHGVRFAIEVRSRLHHRVQTVATVRMRADSTSMAGVKDGILEASGSSAAPTAVESGARWTADAILACIDAPEATVTIDGRWVEVSWQLAVPPRSTASATAMLGLHDSAAVFRAPAARPPWRRPDLGAVTGIDPRAGRWVAAALDQLDALRLTRSGDDRQFLAAGAPWFLTLFGRDGIWAARLLLPLGTELAVSTLQALAELQGRAANPLTEEQPGKILHEMRRSGIAAGGIDLPPVYYGTIDATVLWVCLLHDCWRAGMPDVEVAALLPALEAALVWMRDFGDRDGDGLIEHLNESGNGLSNQGWKDSGDSVQWRDGSLAIGPLALCEVQGYAYEAALGGAAILDRFAGSGAGAEWRDWATRAKTAFREKFWVTGAEGRYPAIALDEHKRPVDSLTSNIGHLLGTGILNPAEEDAVVSLLIGPSLRSGFGIRTLSDRSGGYWPLSYHGGAVWPHDTAIAVRGMLIAGHRAEAALIAAELVDAAAAFDYCIPELYSGHPATVAGVPVPYPAACRPQAWSAASAIVALEALRSTAASHENAREEVAR